MIIIVTLDVLHRVGVCFMVRLLFLEKSKNKIVFLSLLLNLNIRSCNKTYWLRGCWLNLASLQVVLLFCIWIILVSFIFQLILSSMNAINISRLKLRLSLFLIYLAIFKWQISLSRLSHNNNIIFFQIYRCLSIAHINLRGCQ
jgi:hypothetical protein